MNSSLCDSDAALGLMLLAGSRTLATARNRWLDWIERHRPHWLVGAGASKNRVYGGGP